MNPDVLDFLTQVPVIALPETTLTIPEQDAVLEAYKSQINSFLASRDASTLNLDEVVDIAMRFFNAENFSGELGDEELETFDSVLSRFRFGQEEVARGVLRLLTCDGEMPSPCVKYPALLLLCSAMVASATPQGALRFPPTNIWAMRVTFRHQLCLQHRSHTLFVKLASCVEAQRSPDAIAETLLEVGYIENYFHRRDLAHDSFVLAQTRSGLQVEESSMMGVRTRWQQQQYMQAVVTAKSARPATPKPSAEAAPETLEQPVTVGGESAGHDLLDRPREAADAQPSSMEEGLTNTDKAILLALCTNIKNNNPHHGLTKHHMQIYAERLLADPSFTPFLLKAQTLLLRSRLEQGRPRVAERAFLQMQELVDQHSAKRNPLVKTLHRTNPKYFYLVAYPSIWSLKREFAGFCYDENLFKTALDTYEQILDWEKIIECCKQLDKRKKAENLAREMIEKDPSNPSLWVALGEATREDAHLWKAWELSGHRSAAPMRSLARLALEREHYEKVVEYFEAAVKINPVFGGDWFSLGFASMRLKDMPRSGEAFTRVCQIDPNDAFAWNNLASILLQQDKKRPAFNAMSQALRNNRRSWRMWQNYFSIAVELLEVTEATHAIGVAIEIAQRQIHLESASMIRFTDMAIRFMNGEIQGSGNVVPGIDDQEDGEEDLQKKKNLLGTAEVTNTHLAMAEDAGNDDEAAFANLVPLAHDVEMPESFFPEKAAKEREASEAVRRAVLERYKGRIRTLFTTILDLFVDDAELYACAATMYRYLDGPLAALELRKKELRCTQQQEEWKRTEAPFLRVVDCLESMKNDADAALAIGAASAVSEDHDLIVKQALEGILVDMDAALHTAAEYLDESAGYRRLMILRKKTHGELKTAFQ